MHFQTKSKNRSNHKKKHTLYVNKYKRSIMHTKNKIQKKCMYKEKEFMT